MLHITPHGAISDRCTPALAALVLVVTQPMNRLLFARGGASAIVLVDHEQPAREMQTIGVCLYVCVCVLLCFCVCVCVHVCVYVCVYAAQAL